ncbi:MFS transporter [Azospirillum baldaniorum]|uniref:Permease of the major facilitator superfamily MFS-1 n=1 Tax=Azospirillum baldaniorum TaxID=1064539 RepID=A0A9P1NMA2_9PROT|nr:MFS transporter [Azospirillum baldaniorum]AWJ89987.1 MFS transporter [Azospirillum baldaniorum]TWA67432.1 putative MFS family arabinose efflux permease [Azospirillum baldaniorum]TWA77478.1 putative MFS family arabinose efflux permease [Azospirillum brasilense]CCC97985.1 putative permease of the major facilitator superfamily MFS-1 [Azospirillum baldaniorum]
MTDTSARLSIGFSWIGHALMHIVSALFLTVVLALEREWKLPYDELIRLWTLGALMIGVGAPLAGWLGDRWSECRMMAVFFLLTGAGTIACGLTDGPEALLWALAVLGLGSSIYHPVGMAWMVKNATNRGKALGYQGIFGTIGIASAAVVAGGLTEWLGWRSAFLIPGAVCLGLGVVLALLIATGKVEDRQGDVKPIPKASRGDVIRAFFVLSVTMVCAGLMFNAMQVVLPKLFEARLSDLLGGSTLGVGGVVTAVYLFAALPQLIGGHLADKYPLKRIYTLCLLVQVPMMAAVAVLADLPLVGAAALVVVASQVQIPAENLLLARYTPEKHRGLAYGAKFILSFGAGPLAVQLVALVYERTGEFVMLYITLSVLALVAFAAALLLPRDRDVPAKPAAAPMAAAE